jgi:hypothetical protein
MNPLLLRSIFLSCIALAICLDGSAQNAPANFAGSAAGTTITLTWTASTSGGAQGYVIRGQRLPDGTMPAKPAFADLATITNDVDFSDGAVLYKVPSEVTTSYNGFTNIAAGGEFVFRIYTYDANSDGSSAADITVFTLATAPGAYPGSFTFSATPGTSNITLSFTKASKLPMDAHGYLVLRKQGSNPGTTGILQVYPTAPSLREPICLAL